MIFFVMKTVNMMFTRGSPKILALSKAALKRLYPKASASKKCGGTSKEGNDCSRNHFFLFLFSDEFFNSS